MQIFTAEDVQSLSMRDAIDAMRVGFVALSTGRANVPVRYRLTPDGAPRAVVHSAAGVEQWEGTALDAAWSRRVFLRDDALRQIDVLLPRSTLPDVAHAQGGRADGPDS